MFVQRMWTVGKRLVAGFGLAALTLVADCGRLLPQRLPADRERAWVAHTHQVRTELADLLSELKDAETGQRGYVITGDESYLEPYKSALGAIQDHARRRAQAHRRQSQSAAAARRPCHPLIDAQAGGAQADHRSAPDPGVRRRHSRSSLTNVGKTTMDQIRAIVTEADQEEQDPAEAALRRRRAPAPT